MSLKKIGIVGFAVIIMLTTTGCGRNLGSKGSNGKDVVTINIGHVEAEDRSTHRALVEHFKKPVEEKSKGSISVQIYANSVLGGDSELTESVAMGTLEAALPSTSVLVSYSDDFGIMDMPYLFNSPEKAFEAMDGDLGDYFNEKLEKVGIHGLGYSYNGLRSMTNSSHPIETPEDLKGLKMRVMENEVFIDFFETLGASATPMSFNELFTGLQQHTVDGQENPSSLIYASKFQEVQKYLSLTEHVNNFLGFIMNKDFYDSLTKEQQEIVQDAAQEFVDYQRKMELEDTEEYVKKLEEEGMQVNKLTDEQKIKFRQELEPMYEKYEEKFGEEIFETLEKYQ